MGFHSILFDAPLSSDVETSAESDCFSDLHLRKIFDSMTVGREEYDLQPFFYHPLRRVDSVTYRHEIFRDLEQPQLLAAVTSFAKAMRTMRKDLALSEKLYYPRQKQRWFLDAAQVYCEAVSALSTDLASSPLRARGWNDFQAYLSGYVGSRGFLTLETITRRLLHDISNIEYGLRLNGPRIEVRPFVGEPDYSRDIELLFEKFRHSTAPNYAFGFPDDPNMNHVEAAILDRVVLLFPEIFGALDQYYRDHQGFTDPVVRTFDREVQFYLACLEYVARFRVAGLRFCYPSVSGQSRQVHAYEAFDLALAEVLMAEKKAIVTNDFYLGGPERILVVSGANQGGKTTFARTFGQLHYLASIGCPVPARDAQLFLYDRLWVHFEREERVATLTGKLEEDLQRLHYILERTTADSIVILNESFGSTTLSDALFVGRAFMQRITERGALCVVVTFLEELASLSEATVSVVSTVDTANPDLRTFKIIRQPPNGRAYALSIAERYGLTYDRIKERLTS